MIGIIEDRRAEVAALCERYGVKRLDLFGSAAGDGFDPEASDLDFVVSFERRDPPGLFDRYFGLKEDLEVLLEAAGLTSLRRTPCSRTRTSQRASQGSGCPLCGLSGRHAPCGRSRTPAHSSFP